MICTPVAGICGGGSQRAGVGVVTLTLASSGPHVGCVLPNSTTLHSAGVEVLVPSKGPPEWKAMAIIRLLGVPCVSGLTGKERCSFNGRESVDLMAC